MATSRAESVAIYEATRRWGNHAGCLQLKVRRSWNRFMGRHGGGELCRLRLIALEYGLDKVQKE
jgi:hypothetical protein